MPELVEDFIFDKFIGWDLFRFVFVLFVFVIELVESIGLFILFCCGCSFVDDEVI